MHFDYKVESVGDPANKFGFFIQGDAVEAFSVIFREHAPSSIYIFDFKFCYADAKRIREDIAEFFPDRHSTPASGDPDRRSYWNLSVADRVKLMMLAE